MVRRRFVILDRDGTIIVHKHHLTDPREVELIPGVAAGLRELGSLGLGLVVVTNQSIVGRGELSPAGLRSVHRRLRSLLAAEEVTLEGVYTCPHRPDDGCDCRKPKPGLVDRAAREFDFSPSESFLVGDNTCDVGLGLACGAVTFFVRNRYGAPEGDECPLTPDVRVADFSEAVEGIRARLRE